ncbi:MAG TPA: selenium cofactor biosynthesis protein YqeC [Geminicoccaceae bacterium]
MDREAADRLLDALAARRGLICAVGAGGKKSTLARLAEALRLVGVAPVGATATVLVAPFAADPDRPVLVEPPERLEQRLRDLLADHPSLAYAAPSSNPQRLGGVAPGEVARLHRALGFAVTLVKADGARMRLIKAPAEAEPVLPPGADLVLPVVSVQAIGRPLDERVGHRVDRLSRVIGLAPGGTIGPEHLARLLASATGALQNVGDARVVPVINAVDDPVWLIRARQAAEAALAVTRRFDRVLLSRMHRPDPVVEVIVRG